MSDWYNEYKERMFAEAVEATNIPIENVMSVYGFLRDFGLIDYDIEKEVFWDIYNEDG